MASFAAKRQVKDTLDRRKNGSTDLPESLDEVELQKFSDEIDLPERSDEADLKKYSDETDLSELSDTESRQEFSAEKTDKDSYYLYVDDILKDV